MKHKLYLLSMIFLLIVVGTMAFAALIFSSSTMEITAKIIWLATVVLGWGTGIKNIWNLIIKSEQSV